MWRSAPSPRGEGAPIATCLLLLMEILISQKLLYTTNCFASDKRIFIIFRCAETCIDPKKPRKTDNNSMIFLL